MKIEIIILGLLMECNLYGYEIKKKIMERVDQYVDIKFGSIYYAIKKALENEWVKKVGTEKDGGNPERYIYQILPAGRKYYKKLLKQYFDQTMIHFDIDIVLMFFDSLEKDQKEVFIEERREIIKTKLAEIKDKIDKEEKKKTPETNLVLYSYIENHLKAELSWIKSLE
ncbi:MAG TPA: PadR family transcriptional regulator [Spirochaetota bacterium]